MHKKTTVHLSKLFLWPESNRFQAYPEFLAGVDPQQTYGHMADVARRVGGHRMLDSRHVKHENIVRNLPGMEYNLNNEPVIRGIGLFTREGDRYRLSEWGKWLRNEYLVNPTGQSWKVALAWIILSREPRVRSIVKVLSEPGGILEFSRDGFFQGRYRQAVLRAGGKEYWPFVGQSENVNNIQKLLDDTDGWALGAWRENFQIEEVIYEGANKPEITIERLSIAIKAAFTLFLHLGFIDETGGRHKWNSGKAIELLGPKMAEDFGWEEVSSHKPSLLEMLRTALKQLQADNGFIVASQLLDLLSQNGVKNPEKELAGLLDRGIVRLEAWDYGQSRHGQGLFGDPSKQLIKLTVYEEVM